MARMTDIVIYEEDSLTRALVQEWLASAGHRVRVGNSCDPAADGRCDLVIASICRPKQAGADSIPEIRAAHADTPVIAISGHFRPGLPAAGSAAHLLRVRRVVAKPLVREELLTAVRVILAHA